MKKAMDILSASCVFTCTGAMAMVGFVVGMLIFEPEHITIGKNK